MEEGKDRKWNLKVPDLAKSVQEIIAKGHEGWIKAHMEK